MIAFTGTPISQADRDTRRVFGDYIDIYDLTRAVTDRATVRVFHESRLITEGVDPEAIDDRADELTAGLDDAERVRLERSAAVMNEIYGAPDRLRTLAADLVEHWATRSDLMRKYLDGPGKGMIVCATRDIAARLYDEIVKLRPGWHHDADDRGLLKVVYTGGPSDESHIRRHVRRPSQLKAVQQRIKDPEDELELVIVQSMLLTGFDAPPLHTLYLDKPMRGAALMQALARVNRPFRGKEDGLLVGVRPGYPEPARGAGRIHRHRPARAPGRAGGRRAGREAARPAPGAVRDAGWLRLAGGAGRRRQDRLRPGGDRHGQPPAGPGGSGQPDRGRGAAARAVPAGGGQAGAAVRGMRHQR